VLTPGLVRHEGGSVGEVEGPASGKHRDTQALGDVFVRQYFFG
jgi:hypothetical protein